MLGLGVILSKSNVISGFSPLDISDLDVWYDFSTVGDVYDEKKEQLMI